MQGMIITKLMLSFLAGLVVGRAAGRPVMTNASSSTAEVEWVAGEGVDHPLGDLQASGLPPSVDWRAKGAVTPVKHQGALGSCWAFAAVAAVEGLNQIKRGRLVSLSEQQVVDCADVDKRSPRRALEWITKNGGITTDRDYPYTGKEGVCDRRKLGHLAATITEYKRTDNSSELALMAAVARQPVAVGMAVDASFFKSYKAGAIYSGPCVAAKNHCLTVVGYGQKGKDKFWIAKNSFGTEWGDKGYALLRRGLKDEGGLCQIAVNAVYPNM